MLNQEVLYDRPSEGVNIAISACPLIVGVKNNRKLIYTCIYRIIITDQTIIKIKISGDRIIETFSDIDVIIGFVIYLVKFRNIYFYMSDFPITSRNLTRYIVVDFIVSVV